MKLLRVMWKNKLGTESKAHYAYNFDKALCGQWLPEFFIPVPEEFGMSCSVCIDEKERDEEVMNIIEKEKKEAMK